MTVAYRRFFPGLSKLFKCFVDCKHKTNDMAKYWKGFETLVLFILSVLSENIKRGKTCLVEIHLFTTDFWANEASNTIYFSLKLRYVTLKHT